MSFLPRLLEFGAAAWRWLRAPVLLGAGLAVGFLAPYLVYLDSQVRSRFDDLRWQIPTRVYARPLALVPGAPLNAESLALELDAARYVEDEAARTPGTFSHAGNRYVISRRAFVGLDGKEPQKRIGLSFGNNRVAEIVEADSGKPLAQATLDPARIATLYGALEEERRVVQLEELPPLLVAGLQAVEDRDFKHHHGINVLSIARAAVANLMARRVVQGGSTLTQQLVKNLFLDRSQNMLRKVNEALLSLLIEARYDKRRILEAYVNEVFLGQQGGQAVHGFAAAGEFYFGRDLRSLTPGDIALLIGLVQGPSLYDPRRSPERALARRNLVLAQLYDTGLIDAKTLQASTAAPLGVAATAALPRNRFPAFLDVVRAQLTRDYPDAELNGAGLAIHTTLAPSSQLLAEQSVDKALAALGKKNAAVDVAVVVTGARNGEVEAVVGGRDIDEPGFNRAVEALRPIGSLVKPFVYLVALAQPQRYSLATLVDDTPIDLPQPDGSRWTPKNAEGDAHGAVPMIDGLVHSWNLATIHLGMRVGVDRVRGFLQSFGLKRDINPNPSLLVGAVDMSPLDVAHLYQYLASDGHAMPLRAVRGLVDARGKTLSRYERKPGTGDYVDAVRLVTYAMQKVAESGTAHSIVEAGLANLHAAGKTGTSDTQRDSWFAGFTGSHLAVVWIGRDDNKPTGLMGATGALKVWIELFRHLPTTPLAVPQDGLELAWIDPASGKRTDAACEGAREMPFVRGYAPEAAEHCPLDALKRWLGGDRAGGREPSTD